MGGLGGGTNCRKAAVIAFWQTLVGMTQKVGAKDRQATYTAAEPMVARLIRGSEKSCKNLLAYILPIPSQRLCDRAFCSIYLWLLKLGRGHPRRGRVQ